MASGSKEPITPIFWHIAQTGLIERWDTSQTLALESDLSTHFRRGLIKEVFAFDLLPLSPKLIDAPTWDNNMAMRMIIQASGMGMKNRRHTDIGPQISRIEPKVFQRTGSTSE